MNQEQINEMNESLNEFRHYGVKGMRWGVRKAVVRSNVKGRTSKIGSGAYERASDANLKVRQLQSKKSAAKLKRYQDDFKKTDGKIKAMNKRMDKALAKDIKDIDASDRSRGAKFLSKAAWTGATKIGKTVRSNRIAKEHNRLVRESQDARKKQIRQKQAKALDKIHNQLKSDVKAVRKSKNFLSAFTESQRLQAKAEETASIALLQIEVAAWEKRP